MDPLKERLLDAPAGAEYGSSAGWQAPGSSSGDFGGPTAPPPQQQQPREGVLALLRRLFCQCSSGRLPLVARWEMDPLSKWYRFSVFPRTLLLHLALIVTVTTQVVLVDHTVRQDARARPVQARGCDEANGANEKPS
jgi:hypothetical protein